MLDIAYTVEPLAKLPQFEALLAFLGLGERLCRWMLRLGAVNSAIWTQLWRRQVFAPSARPAVAACVGYVTSLIICSTVTTRMPNIRWQNTLGAPRTRTWLPPQLSFRLPLTRSAEVRWL